jgi:NitT/TauT family transport system substrate-binding protein
MKFPTLLMSVFLFFCVSNRVTGQELIRFVSFPSFGKNSPIYLAKHRGYFASVGLAVEVVHSFQDAVLPVAAKKAEIANVLCTEALEAIQQTRAYQIIAARDAMLPVGTLSLENSSIKSPTDYHGKLWGHSQGWSPEKAILPIIAKRTNLDPTSVRIIHLEFAARLPALITGEVHFISAWWGSGYPPLKIAAQKRGIDLRFIRWSDYDIDLYGNCLLARKDWLEAKPNAIKGFLNGLVRGFEEAIANPTAAIEAVIAQNPNQSSEREVLFLSWQQSTELVFDKYSRSQGMFAIEESKLARTRDILDIKNPLPIVQTYTNSYLPRK